MSRGALRAAIAAAVTVVATVAMSVPAAQATTYRYWTYWVGDADGWTYASVGPASDVPSDGTVQGWRFAVTEGVRGQGKSPRLGVTQAFSQFCGSTPVTPGRKRVAVVLDFGDASDAPEGQSPPAARGTCVVAEPSATGARILSAAAQVRTDRGLVCAIAGYPAGECAPAVEDAAPARTSRPETPPRMPSPAAEPATEKPDQDSPADNQTVDRSGTRGASSSQVAGETADDAGDAGSGNSGDAGSGNSGGTGSATGGAGAPRPAPSSSPTQSRSPATPSASPSTSAPPAEGGPSPTPPVFVEASTLEPPATSEPAAPWLPLAATGAALAAVGGVIVWRRRGSRAPTW